MTEIYINGAIEGKVLKLDEPLSFWGGFDPVTGEIIDVNHPQRGQSIKGKVLALPYAKGSAGTPAAVCEAIRAGCGPIAILVREPDANLATGLRVAQQLYGIGIPARQIDEAAYNKLKSNQKISYPEQAYSG